MRLPALSIRARALLLMTVVAVPYTAFQIYAGVKAYRTTLRNAEDRVVSVATSTASALEQFLAVTERSTGSLAERLGPRLLTAEGCADSMGALRDAFPYFINLLVVDSAGTLVCSAREVPEGGPVSAADRFWFQNVRDQRRFTVGRPVRGPVTDRWVVATGSPIEAPDGRFLGAVAGTVELLRLEDLLRGRAPRANELVTITTNDGVVVARSIDAEEWVGRPLPSGTVEVERRGAREFITRTEDVSGLARIWGRIDLPEYGLRVYLGVPRDRVVGPTLATLRTEALVSILALLGAFAVAILLVRGISDSMTLLAAGVRAAARGDRVSVPEGAPREVAQVVDQLNRALDERQRLAAAERMARERIHDIVENAVFGIYVADADGRLLQVNRALVAMLGYDSHQELLAVPPERLYRDPVAPRALAETYRLGDLVEDHELQFLSRDGTPVSVVLNGKRHRLPTGDEAFEMIVEDVTERRELEDLTRHQQKMEAVGRLAGGVAHEFNNLLTVLGVNSELVRQALGPDHPLAQEVEEMDIALGHARGLTRKLLAFSRKEVAQPELLDVNEVLRGLQGMLRRVLTETVALRADYEPGAGPVWMDRSNLEQVVLNLVLNARDALGLDGGAIRITTSTRAAAARLDDDDPAHGPPRWYTVISVEDDGPGMSEQLRRLVFEPFFTTKPPGVGTGLGLPTVYGIVTEAGGRVELVTAPDQGATFEIWLPVATGALEADDARLPDLEATALLVSTHPPLRALARDALEACGVRVLEAGSAAAAVDLFWRHSAPVDLLVTEPGLEPFSGELLWDRLRRERRELGLVLLGSTPGTHPEADGCVPVPFGPGEMAAGLQEALAHGNSASRTSSRSP